MKFIHMADDTYLSQNEQSERGFRVVPNREPHYNSRAKTWDLYYATVTGKGQKIGTFKKFSLACRYAELLDLGY